MIKEFTSFNSFALNEILQFILPLKSQNIIEIKKNLKTLKLWWSFDIIKTFP